ncbi:MAG: hypothetical protein L3K01_08965 [Thermoplasmata archaeon]|nr:hypothetical protein [Thermoplasmata archaeon]
MDQSGDPPRRARAPRIWIVLGVVAVALSVVGVAAILADFAVPPACSIPGGSSGRECVNGIEYQFETAQSPIGNHTSVDPFEEATFRLTAFSNNASFGLVINESDAAGPHGSVEVVGCCLENVGAWQTALSPGGSFGAQVPGENLDQVRLLVRG